MKEKLLNLIKAISNNNFRVIAGQGILITDSNINHTQLDKHRDEIGTLCTKLGKVFNHNEAQLETVTEFQMNDGKYEPVEVERYKKNRKGYDMKESIWIGANSSSDEDALAVL